MKEKLVRRKVMKILALSVGLGVAAAFSAFCFDWPQDAVSSDSFYSYFGQLRGGKISSSLIFSDCSPVKAADDGMILAVIAEHDEDMGWFESTLGNAVIMEHSDSVMSVYANLDGENMQDSVYDFSEVKKGTVFALSGNSGWQQGTSCLEFQVIDLLQKSAVNPRLVMPHEGREQPLEVGKISAVSKNGTVYPVWNQMGLPSGQYYFYRTRQKSAVPYKTSFFVNGALVERIIYDRLKQHEMKLCVAGNGFYSSEQVYPSADLQLLSKVMLSSGKNIITVSLNDILGAEKTSEFVIYVK